MGYIYLFCSLLFVAPGWAFTSPSNIKPIQRVSHLGVAGESNSFVDDLQTRFRIAQESNASGASIKQVVADVIAGEYDKEEVLAKIRAEISSAACGK